ncbi:ABC transporter ATP-binding protein [Desulfatiglans anilini]|uniref:ABC transporter ATP-binding protein n=1 Tax=Desulfatiglans anilini TaxID=90728 RepID=UPI0003F62904|nr:ATP-binding cassette domain-containing protein [Desulfatiglans anilini]
MIEVAALTKWFGQKRAVDGVSFQVERGEVLGFLGPNGAGKSTTMRMITGFLPPSSGRVRIAGADILDDPLIARRRFGYLPENAPVYPEMTVNGFLKFIAEIRGFRGRETAGRVDAVMERCYLGEVRSQPVHTLSKGYKQRVCLAQSILHDPDYLIMDEPTDGLDPNQKHEVRQMIQEMAREKAVILSTHILEEVDAVCTRAIIIDRGRIAADDTPGALRARSPHHGSIRITVQGDGGRNPMEILQAGERVRAVDGLAEAGGWKVIRIRPVDPRDGAAEMVLGLCRESGLRVGSITVEEGRLDEVFRMITTSGTPEGHP